MHNRFITLLTFLFLLLPVAAPVWAQGSGVIEGQVFNGTTSDGVPLEGLPVTLWILRDEEVQNSLAENTDEEGRFRFQDLDTEGYFYQFEVEYQGVSYGSQLMAFPEGENILSIPFTVFEPITSDAELWVERAHLILDFERGAILAQEVQIFVNDGNTTYIGSTGEEGGATLHFPLPQGVSGVQLIEGLMSCCVLETERGIASDRPVFPGSDQFVFSYELAYQSPTYTLSKGIAYPIYSLDVLIADVGVEVTAPDLTVEEPLTLEGGRYLHLATQNLTPGDELILNLANLPLGMPEATPAPSATTSPGPFGWLVIILAALAVLLALGYPFLRKRQEEKG
jgi:hypothetical protein